MKKFLCALLALAFYNLRAQYFEQQTPTNEYLTGVSFPSVPNGWAVGTGGVILHTINAGNKWTTQNSGTTKSLRYVQFLNDSTGYAAGDDGTLLFTADSGHNWAALNLPSTASLNTVFFHNQNYGFAAGNGSTMLRTTDGGLNWQKITMPQMTWGLNWRDVHFANSTHGWVVGDNNMMAYTADSGKTWAHRWMVAPDRLQDVHMIDTNTVLICGAKGSIYRTTDGGSTLDFVMSNADISAFHEFSFISKTEGWVFGQGGHVFKTTDAGQTWQKVETGFSTTFYGGHFENPNWGWAVGSGGKIVCTQLVPDDPIILHTKKMNTASLCAGQSYDLPFGLVGNVNPNNEFIAWLSDSTGSFTNQVKVGSVNSQMSGTIPITVPNGVAASANYALRISATDPSTISEPYGYDLMVGSPNPNFTVTNNTLTATDTTLNHQWFFNDDTINQANSKTYVAPLSGNYSLQVMDAVGCVATSSQQAVVVVALAALTKNAALKVWPNPATDLINISSDSPITHILVYNQAGLLMTESFNSNSVAVTNLPAGQYVIKIYTDNHQPPVAFQIVKQ